MSLSKRDVLLALAALAAGAASPAAAQTASPDLSAGRAIAEAYLSANRGTDLQALQQDLLPDRFNNAAGARLRTRAAADFRAARIFVFKGWRLSQTEAQLFALLAA